MKKAFFLFALLLFSGFVLSASSLITSPEIKRVETGSDDEKRCMSTSTLRQ